MCRSCLQNFFNYYLSVEEVLIFRFTISICRIPGREQGADWCMVNTHGWFSYEIKLAPNRKNIICVTAGGESDNLRMIITIGEEKHAVEEKICGKKELSFVYNETEGKDSVRIRIDRASAHTPYVFSITVK